VARVRTKSKLVVFALCALVGMIVGLKITTTATKDQIGLVIVYKTWVQHKYPRSYEERPLVTVSETFVPRSDQSWTVLSMLRASCCLPTQQR